MKISPLLSFGFTFCSNKNTYLGRHISTDQDMVHDIVRTHLEHEAGPQFFYLAQILNEGKVVSSIDTTHSDKPLIKQDSVEVDTNLLKKAGIYAFNERRQNELYTGAQLSQQKDKLRVLKNAGVKTVLSLLVYDDYKKNANSVGLNFVNLYDLCKDGLSVFDIHNGIVDELIRHPEYYADDDVKGKIAGLKEFVNILNGKSVQFPPPVYFGCQWGTDRTFMWYQLYLILKDAPQDKPLSEDVIQKLVKYSQDVKETFRW